MSNTKNWNSYVINTIKVNLKLWME